MTDTHNSDTRRTRLDCPACDELADAQYLGTADADNHAGHVVGWECEECGANLQEDVHPQGDSFDLRKVQPVEEAWNDGR